MKVLAVLGSAGFIAGHVIEEAHAQGLRVIGLQRHIGERSNAPWQADVVYEGDITNAEAVERVVSKADYIINLAGILGTQETINNPMPSVYVNIIGALNALNAMRVWKGKRYVQIAVGNHWMENSYSITKTTAEKFTKMYAKEHGIHANVVRALNAFGERQTTGPVRKIMPSFITRALKGEDIEVYGEGSQLMDMVYVKDVAKVLLNVVMHEEKSGQVFEVGTGVGISVKDIAQKVVDLSNSNSEIKHLPMRPGEPTEELSRCCNAPIYDSGDEEAELGFCSKCKSKCKSASNVVADDPYPIKYTDFETALTKTIDWYKSNSK